MPKGFYKHKVLFDENLPNRLTFPRLNEAFDVKHLRDDFKQAGMDDPDVYELAVSQQRILVTYNSKHFRSLAGRKQDAGIIGISASLSPAQVDTKLTALLRKSTPHAFAGKFTALTGETDI
jgi:predicted nuclease of predicted toxin-antitoxin system